MDKKNLNKQTLSKDDWIQISRKFEKYEVPEFPKSRKGYDRDEVDLYLNELVDAYLHICEELISKENELEEYRSKEKAIADALIKAQNLARTSIATFPAEYQQQSQIRQMPQSYAPMQEQGQMYQNYAPMQEQRASHNSISTEPAFTDESVLSSAYSNDPLYINEPTFNENAAFLDESVLTERELSQSGNIGGIKQSGGKEAISDNVKEMLSSMGMSKYLDDMED